MTCTASHKNGYNFTVPDDRRLTAEQIELLPVEVSSIALRGLLCSTQL